MQHAWSEQDLTAKTRICTCCGKKKSIKQFHFQKPKRQHKIRQHCIDRRRECKSCHYKKMNKYCSEEVRGFYNLIYYMANKVNKSVTQKIKDLLNNGKKMTGSKVVALGASDERFLGKRIAEFRATGMNIETTKMKGETAYKLVVS
jgi:hypothetical protein